MVRNGRRFLITAGFSAIALVATLSGCAASNSSGSTGSSSSNLTLTDTKSPTQLLRNTAASMLHQENISNMTNTEDVSVTCDKDPKVRSWHSTITAGVDVAHESTLATTSSDLVQSLVDKGWKAEVGEVEGGTEVKLTKAGSVSVIHVQALPSTMGALRAAHGAQIVIEVDGPCVKTDGPDSTEVKTLEGRN
jgi:hypothetical protein